MTLYMAVKCNHPKIQYIGVLISALYTWSLQQ